MSPKDCAYIVERLAISFITMVADHERQLSEHRTSFGARTEADAKIIARLQSENVAARMAGLERDSLMSERNGLLTQVQDMRAEMQRLSAQLDWERAEIKRLQWENLTMHKDAEDGYAEAIKVLGDPIALSKERDALRAEVDFLKIRDREYEKALDLCEKEEQTPAECIGSLNARIDRLQDEARSDARVREDLHRINVERAEADRVRIEGLSEELRLERETCTETADLLNRESEKVRGLSVQAQDQRSEIERLRDEAAKYKTERDHFYQREGIEAKKPMDVEDERDALRAEVAALQERLRASIARGDFAQMEVAALRPKYKVGDKLMSHSQSLGPEVPVTVQGIRVVYDCSVDGAKYECVVGHAERELILVASHDTEAGKAAAESVAQHSAWIDIGTWSRKVAT